MHGEKARGPERGSISLGALKMGMMLLNGLKQCVLCVIALGSDGFR